MYPEIMVIPMREELTRIGVQELRSAGEVDRAIVNQPGTSMVIVNSICGCAAGRMRPAVRLALQNSARPVRIRSPPSALEATSRGIHHHLPRSHCCGTAS